MNRPMDVDAIRARLAAISPPPWRSEINENGQLVIHIDDPNQNAVIWCGDMETCTGRDMDNHEFIAHAPAYLKRVLDAYDAAQQRIEQLEAALGEIRALEWHDYGDTLRIAHEIARDVLGASADGAEEE